jgi:AraC-like DNA-binding protein
MKRKDGFPGQFNYVIPQSVQKAIQENPLIADLYFTDIGYYPDARYHYRERIHGVNQTILIYCTSGKGNVKIDSNIFDLYADEFIIIPEGKSHVYYSDNDDPWSIYWIHFRGSKTNRFDALGEKIFEIEKGKESRISSRTMLFHDIFRNLERGFGMDNLEYANMCLGYLLASFIYIDQFRMVNKTIEKDPVAQSINYMLENINKSIRLAELANEVKLSVSHYSRLFLNKTGLSPIDYFNQIRMQRACQLLNMSDLTIGEVARETGYPDPFHFSRIFKKIMGVSPRAHRKTL